MLKKISIKHKLYFIVLLPMCIVLYTSYIDLTKKYDTHLQARETLNKNILNQKIASFVDELQKERAISARYITTRGKNFKFERLQQIDLTNLSYKHLLKYFKNFHRYKKDELYIQLVHFDNELKNIRNEVKNSHIQYSELISFYSMKINLLLDFIYQSAMQTSNVQISNMIYSYSNFLFAKEKNAIINVMISKIVSDKKISLKDKLNLNSLVILNRVNINYFKKFLNDELLIQQFTTTSQTKEKIEIEKTIQKLLTFGFNNNINANSWSHNITGNFKQQHQFSILLAKHLILISNEYKQEISSEMMNLFYINIIILMMFFLFVIVFYSDISHRFDTIVSSIAFISQHNISQYKNIKIKSDDELDQIALKFNQMVDELKVREKKNQKITIDLLKLNQKVENNNRIKSEFLANMSHEIRTPLNAIIGFVDILKDDEIDAKKMRYLDVIKNSSQNLLELINDVLDFSKIENSKIILEYRDINIVEELKFIVALFTIKVKEKNITFNITIDENLPQIIETDNLKLRQVIINLLGNAIKFTNENKTIEFDVKYLDNRLFVSVKDEGIGIEKNKQRLIFEPFLQADSSTTRKYGGTGLGLAISTRLIKALGGKLELESELGKGSKFYFDIPITISKNIKQKISPIESNKILSGKVLLVEDNKSNQLYMKIILKKLGLNFDIANDGLEAVEMFKQNIYDVILMDENMPNMTGIEATKIIRELERMQKLESTPIVALTANALVGDKKRFLDAGMDEYLTKPIDKKVLHTILENFLIL
ncbi:MAG: ATP-binding protein [Arcobacteraceae bacterium]